MENEHRKNKNNSLENEQLLQIICDSVRVKKQYITIKIYYNLIILLR